MRAIVQDKYGEAVDVLRLEEIDRPQIGDDDVLVRVHAASVHIGDWHVMTGLPYLLARWASDSARPTSAYVAWMSQGRSRRSAKP
jgi:NADPH:quinone reductase-like Zn-dependent oxidoreductase